MYSGDVCLTYWFAIQMTTQRLDYIEEVFGTRGEMIEEMVIIETGDFSVAEIAKRANVAKPTIYGFIEELEKNNMVIKSRVVGKTTMYKLNPENFFVNKLVEFIRAYSAEAQYLDEVKRAIDIYGEELSSENQWLVKILENADIDIPKKIKDDFIYRDFLEIKDDKAALTPEGKEVAMAVKDFIEASKKIKKKD